MTCVFLACWVVTYALLACWIVTFLHRHHGVFLLSLTIFIKMSHSCRMDTTKNIQKYPNRQNVSYTQERDISRIFDIGHWTFECPMSNIEYPANFTLLLYTSSMQVSHDNIQSRGFETLRDLAVRRRSYRLVNIRHRVSNEITLTTWSWVDELTQLIIIDRNILFSFCLFELTLACRQTFY